MALSVTVRVAGRVVEVDLLGELDASEVPRLRAAITAALDRDVPPERLVVDLAGVAFLDCAGVGGLIRGREAAAARGIPYTVRGARGVAELVLRVTGTLEYLTAPPAAEPGNGRH